MRAIEPRGRYQDADFPDVALRSKEIKQLPDFPGAGGDFDALTIQGVTTARAAFCALQCGFRLPAEFVRRKLLGPGLGNSNVRNEI